MSSESISASEGNWRWHQAFAIGLNFLWPVLGTMYLGLDKHRDTWSATCAQLYALVFLFWMLTSPTGSVQGFVGIALLWVLLTWGIALWSIPAILKARRIAKRVYTPYWIIPPVIWIAIAALNVYALNPWSQLTVMTAPAADTPSLPSGTRYIALGFDPYDQNLNSGQLITYRDGQEMRIARIIGVPGDIVRVEKTSFFVNGAQFAAETTQPDDREAWMLRDLAEGLRHPSAGHRTIVTIVDFVAALASAPTGAVTRVDGRHLLIASDQDLLNMPTVTLRPKLISLEDVVAVPIAKVWSLDKPGRYSDLAQSPPEFIR